MARPWRPIMIGRHTPLVVFLMLVGPAPGADVPGGMQNFPETFDVGAAAEGWLQQQHMTGTWGGARDRLNDAGIVPNLTYAATVQGNPIGGEVGKVRYFQNIGLDIHFDLQRLVGWTGAIFHVAASSRTGNDLSSDIGNRFTVSEVCCAPTTRLAEAYLGQALLDGRIDAHLGRLTIGDDFMTSPLYWLYVSGGIDGNPEGPLFDVPYTTYPVTSWGARVRTLPLPSVYVMAGVYQSNPDLQRNRAHGVDFGIGDSAVLATAEVGWLSNQETGATGLPGNYKVGGYYDTDRFESVTERVPGAAPRPAVWGNGGFYFLLDQMVFRENGTASSQGLTPWVALTVAPLDEVNLIPFSAYGGLVYRGLIPGRDGDAAMVGGIYGRFSERLRDAQAGAGVAAQNFEAVLEWSYLIQVAPWLAVQPDIQYVIRPGGTGEIPNALVLGFQLAVNI
jgi:porin